MRNLLSIAFVLMTLFSCKKEKQPITDTNPVTENQHVVVDTIEHFRIVKTIKEENETSTSYHYKYDWLNGRFRQQPRIQSETKYYVVFTDGSIEETTKQKGMFYEKGDTVKSYSYVYK